MYAITVVGGGAIGLNIAIKLFKEGWETNLIEEHKEVGKPTNCSGLLSLEGLEKLNIDVKDVALNYINGTIVYTPDLASLEINAGKNVAVVVDRHQFDLMFYNQAKNLGVPIKFNTKALNINGTTLFVQNKGRGELIKSRIILGADGVSSSIRKSMGLELPTTNFIQAYQEFIKGDFKETKKVLVFMDTAFEGFFAWLIPISSTDAEIGLGVKLGADIKGAITILKEKLKQLGYDYTIKEKRSFMIPYNKMLDTLVKNNLMLAGDAAFQTKSTTGGGLIFGLNCSNKAVDAISDYLKYQKPLEAYQEKVMPFRKELELHWKIRSYLNKQNNNDLNSLMRKLKGAGIEEFLGEYGNMDEPSKFVPMLMKKPKFWLMAPQLIKFMTS